MHSKTKAPTEQNMPHAHAYPYCSGVACTAASSACRLPGTSTPGSRVALHMDWEAMSLASRPILYFHAIPKSSANSSLWSRINGQNIVYNYLTEHMVLLPSHLAI